MEVHDFLKIKGYFDNSDHEAKALHNAEQADANANKKTLELLKKTHERR